MALTLRIVSGTGAKADRCRPYTGAHTAPALTRAIRRAQERGERWAHAEYRSDRMNGDEAIWYQYDPKTLPAVADCRHARYYDIDRKNRRARCLDCGYQFTKITRRQPAEARS